MTELSFFQQQQVKWLKSQVQRLVGLKLSRDAPSDIEVQLFAAREELDDYVGQLRDAGVQA
jgi:hypothetical protein